MSKKKKAYIIVSLSWLILYLLWLLYIFNTFAFIELLSEWRELLLKENNTLVLTITILSTMLIGVPSFVMLILISIDKLKSLDKCESDISACENKLARLKQRAEKNEASFKYIDELFQNNRNKVQKLNRAISYFEEKGLSNIIKANEINKNLYKICKHSKLAKNTEIGAKLKEYQDEFKATSKSFRDLSD